MTFKQKFGIRCDVNGRPHPLAFLDCRELNYGQHSVLPLHPFRLSVPETALAGLLDGPFNSFIQTCREDDLRYEESDLPQLMQAGYPDITAMLAGHRPLLAEMLDDFMIGDLMGAIGRASGYCRPRARYWGDVEAADGRAYFTVNQVEKIHFADGQVLFEGQGYYGVYLIWLTHGKRTEIGA
ncbi:hypothetical protein [Janthinobacterium sp. 1_2014MBL_MicDiv]|uniref:hypothetical protein n=1 Tax=Janthinobacterium sp. 1_2014MBL_MicDiv TaxID=1644131 RepID=UPI0008F4AFAA|nr:hypothetical protein [Janthinobacterium sp. 1_2014MBL_MicDiv]APA67876.1 hypothetical protein YQ44_08525 [Janthinobacterium sp. 1_2014MBL_MicDiv]